MSNKNSSTCNHFPSERKGNGTARHCEENREHNLSGENPLQYHQQGNYER